MVRSSFGLRYSAGKYSVLAQSGIPELVRLTWFQGCHTPMGLVMRAHAYKDATAMGVEYQSRRVYVSPFLWLPTF